MRHILTLSLIFALASGVLIGCGEVDPTPAAPPTFTILDDDTSTVVWGGGASSPGDTINVALIDAENGEALTIADGVQIIFSAEDGGDLSLVDLPGPSYSFAVDTLQPRWLSVVDTQQRTTISFYGNPQAPLRGEYAVPVVRPVTLSLTLRNLPANVLDGSADLQVLVNGVDVSDAVTMDGSDALVDLSSARDLIEAGSFRKGEPLMAMALVRDQSNGRILDGVAYIDEDGVSQDAADWASFALNGAGTTPGGNRQLPLEFASFVEGAIAVPSTTAGVTASTENSQIALTTSNEFGTWSFAGRVLSPINANSRYEVDYPIFRDDSLELEPELSATSVQASLAYTPSAGADTVWLDLIADVTTPAAQDFFASDLMFSPSQAQISVARTELDVVYSESDAWLIADARLGRRLRALCTVDADSQALVADWLTGDAFFPLTLPAASLRVGAALMRGAEGEAYGLGTNNPGLLPVAGDFNGQGDSLALSTDARLRRAGGLGPITQLDATLESPLDVAAFNLVQDRIAFTLRNVQTQQGLIHVRVSGDVGGAPAAPVSWSLWLPISATHAQGSSSYHLALPRLAAAPSDFSPSVNDDAVDFSIRCIDLTSLGLRHDALNFANLGLDAGRALFSQQGSLMRSFTLPKVDDVDLR